MRSWLVYFKSDVDKRKSEFSLSSGDQRETKLSRNSSLPRRLGIADWCIRAESRRKQQRQGQVQAQHATRELQKWCHVWKAVPAFGVRVSEATWIPRLGINGISRESESEPAM
jgi:hypothetical protein